MMLAAVICLSVFAMTSFAGAVYTETVDGITVTFGEPIYVTNTAMIVRYEDDQGAFHDISLTQDSLSMTGSVVTGSFVSDQVEISPVSFRVGFVCEIPLTYSETPSSVSTLSVVSTAGTYSYTDSNFDDISFTVNDDSAINLVDDEKLLITVWQNYSVTDENIPIYGINGNSISFDISGLVSPVAGSGGSGSDDDDGDAELQGTSMDQLLQDTGTVASTTLSVVSSAVATITENPFLLMTAGLLLLGAAVGILRRLLNRG